MSWLLFNQIAKQIELYGGKAPNYCAEQYPSKVGAWSAHNEVASSSMGKWPSGVFGWSHYNLHAEMGMAPGCHPTSYGCFGIHVFKVPGRQGMGIHAGRTQGEPNKLGKKTMGCIRVPANAMEAINKNHNKDPLEAILIY